MKKFLSIISISLLLLSSSGCLKDDGTCTPKSVQSEQAAIQAYATTNNIVGTFHSSGIYYEIVNQGSGPTPTISSTVTANYTGRFITNNTIFDQTTPASGPASFPLQGVIAGWQIALPLIQKGGNIKIIVPSSLAYGCSGFRTIAPDEVLFFDITLVDVR